MKVLAVDDDPICLELLRETLESEGHDVTTVEDGEEALSLLRSGDTRVLITDWEMPGLNGPALCQAIREVDFGRYIFIIMLTSHSSHEDLIEGLRSGADDFLSKPFDPIELSVRLSVANRVSALETRDLMIFTLAKLAESRDPETGQHLERVRLYCRMLADELIQRNYNDGALTPEFSKLIFMTSPLHDIGKVGIPDAVLLKPGKLTDEEFNIMRQHSRIGAETLDAALRRAPGAQFLLMARDIAATHHERFDGTGYPNGISGTDIPLSGRIMAIADVYDALRSKRVYKAAMPHEKAASIIREGRGTHFDPDLVDAFNALEAQFADVSECLSNEGDDLPVLELETAAY